MNRVRAVLDARQFTVRTQLALSVTLLIGAISLFIYFYFPTRIERQAESALANKVESIAEAMAYAVSPALVFEDQVMVQHYLGEAGRNNQLAFVVVLDARGETIAAVRGFLAQQLEQSTSMATGASRRNNEIMATRVPIRVDGQEIGSLHLGLSLESLHAEVAEARYTVALISLLIFVVGLIGTFGISTLVTRRLGRIAKTFDVISAGDLSQRARVSGDDEISDLARSFNMMVDQVEAAHLALRETNISLEARVAERTRELQTEVEGHKQTAEELQASEGRFRAMFSSAGVGIALLDKHGRVLKSNPAICEALGCAQEELNGRVLGEFAYEDDVLEIAGQFAELVLGTRERVDVETRCYRSDGSLMWAQVTISALPSIDGRTQFAIGMFDDITERKRLEHELEEAQKQALMRERDERERAEETAEKLWHIPRTNPIPVVELRPDGELSYVNEAGEALAERVGASVPAELLPKSLEDIVEECLASGETASDFEVKLNGTTLTWSFYPILPSRVVYGYAFDISKRLELETQLREAQKLEAVGRLAGGIAHDFNNVLMAITGISDMVLEDLGNDDPIREDLKEIQQAAERAASLTRQLLAFSRRQMLKPVELDLNAVLADMQKMLRRLIGEDVELVTVLEPDLWKVEADAGQIEQVLMNLAVNARDALPDGGTLTIETRNLEVDRAASRRLEDIAPGHYVMVTVSDDGTGMTEETRSQVFEPFFTTKELGKGTGLGLSTCYGIVKQTGGSITVESEVGLGTTFRILLPMADEVVEDAVPKKGMGAPLSGLETILLVEDEDAVRKLASRALRKQGYTVMEAAHGGEALEIVERLDEPVDLIITDVVMPHISGRELIEQVAVLWPETSVIYMTGYTDDAIIHHGVLDSGIELIQKPFKPRVLLEKVREVLDGEPALVQGAA